MMKILLADPSELWCDALEDQLKGHYMVLRCTDGGDVMQMLFEHRPDLILLGLDLPNVDGLTLLQLIHASGIPVRILTASYMYNEYIYEQLSQFKISYMLKKPCTICSVMSQIYQIIHNSEVTDNAADPAPVLLAMGFRMNLAGYTCLRTAIKLFRENPDFTLTKSIYPDVAKICGGNKDRVERAIRNSIHDAWKRRDERIWRAYFSVDRMGRMECPSNGDFIVRIALGGNDNRACG